jgi:hypothetical protein
MREVDEDQVDGGDDNGEIAHLMWETVKIRVLRAGSLRRVIEAIANEDTDAQVCGTSAD